jgi:hypothetical protein
MKTKQKEAKSDDRTTIFQVKKEAMFKTLLILLPAVEKCVSCG